MSEPNYVVIRDPEEPAVSGKWFNLSGDDGRPNMSGMWTEGVAVVYVPTPFIEVRDDGAVAQVYMRRKP